MACTSPPKAGTSCDTVPDWILNLPFEGDPAEREGGEVLKADLMTAVDQVRPGTLPSHTRFNSKGDALVYDRPVSVPTRVLVAFIPKKRLDDSRRGVSPREWQRMVNRKRQAMFVTRTQAAVIARRSSLHRADDQPAPRRLHHRRAHQAHGPPSSKSDDEPSPAALTHATELARKLAWDGPLYSVELLEQLRRAGISQRTAERAIGPNGLRMTRHRAVYGGPVLRALPEDGALTKRTILFIRRAHRVRSYAVTTRSRYGDTKSQHDVAHRQHVRIEKRSLIDRGWRIDDEFSGDLSQAERNYVSAVAHLVRVEMDARRRQSPRDLKAAILGEKSAREALSPDADVHRLRALGEIEAGIGVAA